MRVLPSTAANSSFWLRTSFSDTTSGTLQPTYDILGSNLISGNLPATSTFSLVSGMVLINNATGGNKTYYYIAGRTQVINGTLPLLSFGGGNWNEDNIAAFRI
jgi:hypothetical protein